MRIGGFKAATVRRQRPLRHCAAARWRHKVQDVCGRLDMYGWVVLWHRVIMMVVAAMMIVAMVMTMVTVMWVREGGRGHAAVDKATLVLCIHLVWFGYA